MFRKRLSISLFSPDKRYVPQYLKILPTISPPLLSAYLPPSAFLPRTREININTDAITAICDRDERKVMIYGFFAITKDEFLLTTLKRRYDLLWHDRSMNRLPELIHFKHPLTSVCKRKIRQLLIYNYGAYLNHKPIIPLAVFVSSEQVNFKIDISSIAYRPNSPNGKHSITNSELRHIYKLSTTGDETLQAVTKLTFRFFTVRKAHSFSPDANYIVSETKPFWQHPTFIECWKLRKTEKHKSTIKAFTWREELAMHVNKMNVSQQINEIQPTALDCFAPGSR